MQCGQKFKTKQNKTPQRFLLELRPGRWNSTAREVKGICDRVQRSEYNIQGRWKQGKQKSRCEIKSRIKSQKWKRVYFPLKSKSSFMGESYAEAQFLYFQTLPSLFSLSSSGHLQLPTSAHSPGQVRLWISSSVIHRSFPCSNLDSTSDLLTRYPVHGKW